MRKNPVNKPRSPRPQAVGFWHLATLHGWCCHRLRGDVPGHWVGIEILGLLGSSRIDQTMRISTFFWGMHSVLHSYIIFSWVCPFGELTFVYSFTSTMFLTSVGCRRMCSRCGPSPQHCLRFCLSIWNWVAKDWKKGSLHHLFYSFTICNYLWQICTEFTIDILRTLAAGLLARQGGPAL